MPIAEEGRNTAIYHLGCGQAQLSALFYCLSYVTKPPCETQASDSSLSDDEGGNPPKLEPTRGNTVLAARILASVATERTPSATLVRRTSATASPAVPTRNRHAA